jgi:signal peptidase I
MQIDRQSLLFHFFDVILNIVIIVAVVAIVRTFIVSPFQIDGNSMIDTLEHREYIVINKFRYLFHTPSRGDIVVFRPPSDLYKYYVKRVIGLPGETIVVRDGLVFLRDAKKGDIRLNEPYLSPINAGKTYRYPVTSGDTTEEVFTVPAGQYFVMGDNRQGSLDSRSFAHVNQKDTAFIPKKNIKGNVWFIALPLKKIHAFGPQNYEL